MRPKRFTVAQLGARMHYAVPRILHQAAALERLYTDICANRGWPRLFGLLPRGLKPDPVRRLLARIPHGVPADRVTAFNCFGREYAHRRWRAGSQSEQTRVHLWAGREFCRLVLSKGFDSAAGVYCFNSAGLEILEEGKRRGLRGIVEQTIAPKRIECELLETEQRQFQGWEACSDEDGSAAEFMEREAAEWQTADRIVCGSEFVVEGIRRSGGPVGKCVVVPYGVDSPLEIPHYTEKESSTAGRELRVLTVGAVGLRKGSPYVLEAAKRLKGKATFRMVGSVGVTPEIQGRLREHLDLAGPLPRSEMAPQFRWADVFLLPSICEGSATVTYEALAYGLPVICTPNTGSVIRDGREGFIVPIRDSKAIVDRIERLAAHPEFVSELGANACCRAHEFSVEAYGRRLLEALSF